MWPVIHAGEGDHFGTSPSISAKTVVSIFTDAEPGTRVDTHDLVLALTPAA